MEGYTGGGGKAVIDGLMSSGDVGHFDAEGRLFIDGRDDDMIVSGGENVFPSEVEDLLPGPRGGRGGGGRRRRGRRLRPAPAGLRGRARAGTSCPSRRSRTTSRRTWPATRSPRDVVFVDELPRNATGKVLKRELRENPSGAAS